MITRETHPHLFTTVEQEVQKNLLAIESEYNVRILFAIESGSRCWGFHSDDSDYDVRFVYAPRIETYTQLVRPPEVLEQQTCKSSWPVKSDFPLDFSGWDIRKAMTLAHKRNAALYEWLHSPITYVEDHTVTSQMRALIRKDFEPAPYFSHYRGMSNADMGFSKQLTVKKALYAFRTTLAALFVAHARALPPVQLLTLVKNVEIIGLGKKLGVNLSQMYADLIEAKTDEVSVYTGPHLPALVRLAEALDGLQLPGAEVPDTGPYNDLIVSVLR